MARLNADTLVMFLIATGRAFHARGPATERALSLNFVLVRGMSNSLVFTDRSLPRPGIVEFLVIVSVTIGWTSAVIDGIHHKTELVTNLISDR